MTAPPPLARVSTVEALAAALRSRILEGELPGGARLREQELCEAYGVARHSARAALRALAAEGLVRVEPNRGARVAALGPEDLRGLYELRTALEVEAARLALERHGGRLPATVHAAVRRLSAVCARRRPSWTDILEAHDPVHTAIVEAAASPRLAAAHAALAAEQRLFLVGLRPEWTAARMAADHEALVEGLESRGTEALREHLREAAAAVGVETAAGTGSAVAASAGAAGGNTSAGAAGAKTSAGAAGAKTSAGAAGADTSAGAAGADTSTGAATAVRGGVPPAPRPAAR